LEVSFESTFFILTKLFISFKTVSRSFLFSKLDKLESQIKSLQDDKDNTVDALVDTLKKSGNLEKLAKLIPKESGLIAKKLSKTKKK